MVIEFKGDIVSGDCDLEITKLVCVPSHKYQTVELCLKSNGTKGWNIVIGAIDCAIDYSDKKKLGLEIEKRWNDKAAKKLKLMDNKSTVIDIPVLNEIGKIVESEVGRMFRSNAGPIIKKSVIHRIKTEILKDFS
jgi:hypothetical protein